MIDRIKESRINQWVQGWLAPKLARRRLFSVAFWAILGAVLYWGIFASDRYVSETHIIIQRTDLSGGQSVDFTSLLSGTGQGNRTDQMLLRDHLLSVDMMNKVDKQLDLRTHWSQWRRDPLARLWSKNASQEALHAHYRKRISVEYDDFAGVLIIKAQAYEPEVAQAIATLLVEEGEAAMNELSRSLAEEQVSFLSEQVENMSQRALLARQELLNFQNENGMASPESTAESLTAGINRLEAQLTDLRARRSVLMGYLTETAPGVVEVDLQIAAVRKQIAEEQKRIAAPSGNTLNATVEEYQRLQMVAQFAQDIYQTSLVALEKGRLEALRNLKKVSVLQRPTLPERAMEPRRIYNIIVFTLITLLLTGVMHLLAAVIRDHRD